MPCKSSKARAGAARSLAGALAGQDIMRTIVVIIVASALLACTVEAVAPPASLTTGNAEKAPPPPADIRDDPACKLLLWPLSPDRAAAILKSTETFADTGIYYGGEPPPQMAAYNVLLDQPDAAAWFDDVAQHAGPVGRLYALCAFQVIDRQRATALAASLRLDPAQVFAQFGCIGMEESVVNLVGTIQRESYGKFFRRSRERTYKYFSAPLNICTRPRRAASPGG